MTAARRDAAGGAGSIGGQKQLGKNTTSEWKYYGKAFGWALVFSSKKKKLVFLTPALPHFTASFIFNDKGRELSKEAGFSQEILALIESGKPNPAGHAFDLPVRGQETLEIAQTPAD